MYESSLLFNETPLIVNPHLAMLIGLNEAIILQQIHYWLKINFQTNKNYYKGKYWTYNSVTEWHEQFPFWSYDTVKRTLQKLRNMKLLITGNFNRIGQDRTLWYTIDYTEVRLLEDKILISHEGKKAKESEEREMNFEEKVKKHSQSIDNSQWCNLPHCKNEAEKGLNESSEPLKTVFSVKCPDGKVQYAQMKKGNLHRPIPETNTKTNTETNNLSIIENDGLKDGVKKIGSDPSAIQRRSDTQTIGDRVNSVYEINKHEQYRILIAENVECDILKKKYAADSEQINELLDVLVDTVTSQKETHKINGEEIPSNIVKSRLLKVNQGHIEYVLECLSKNTTKIKNIKGYLLTALYNAPTTMSTYYTCQVNHDLYGTPS